VPTRTQTEIHKKPKKHNLLGESNYLHYAKLIFCKNNLI